MRSGSRGSVCRRLVLVVLALVVVGLVAVPAALAADSMVIAGLVEGQYYGGQRPLAATVTVPDPANPGVGTRQHHGGRERLLHHDRRSAPSPRIVRTGPDGHGDRARAQQQRARLVGLLQHRRRRASRTAPARPATVFFNLVVNNTKVSGKVTNAATGRALRGVKVTVVGGKSVKTSKKGRYSLSRALWPATRYKVKFSKSGFKSVTKKFTSAPASTVVRNVLLTKK